MSTSVELEVLQCSSCGVAVALVEAPTVPCRRCGKTVVIPERHTKALRAANDGSEARVRAAEHLALLSEKPQDGLLWLAALAILILPSLATYVVAQFPQLAFSELELNAYAALPAALPGIGLFIWAAAASGTSARFCDALSAAPASSPKGAMHCRTCGAPLAAPSKTHVMCCPYCRSDNLLREVALDALQASLRASLRTLGQAMSLMRVRRALWGLGVASACIAVLGFLALVRFAVS